MRRLCWTLLLRPLRSRKGLKENFAQVTLKSMRVNPDDECHTPRQLSEIRIKKGFRDMSDYPPGDAADE